MGVETKKASAPPLPAPTETESTTTPTELQTDVSRPGDEKSSYSLPEDGTPVTIKTRGHKHNKSQTSLLIEYFEGGKTATSGGGSDRKPSVRVRLTPSKNRRNDHIQITETKSSSRKASLSRRSAPATPTGHHLEGEALSAISGNSVDTGDAHSMNSYASATEESNVSRNPIEVDIDRSGHHRRRRPASPLIPAADENRASYLPGTASEISAIPTDSFLDGSGPTTRSPEDHRSRSPSRGADLLTGAVAGLAAGAAADKLRSKSRGDDRERIVVPKSRDKDRSERKHKSKSRTSSLSEKERDGTRSPRRRSSRSQQDSLVSAADSSVVSSALTPSHRSYDQQSVRSGASKSSINNPKLLETVEDAIRRLILPELNALKREQSRHKDRRGSATSSATSVSREDYGSERRRSGTSDKQSVGVKGESKVKERRDREARHDFDHESPAPSITHESVDEATRDIENTPVRSTGNLKAAAAGAALGGLAAAAMHDSSMPFAREQRRRRRAELNKRISDRYDEYDDMEREPEPPMPLMSEINPSEVTRTSILSAATDRPHSASEEMTPVHEVTRGVPSVESDSTTPTRTPTTLQALGTQHANISHGDLKALPRQSTGEFIEHEYEIDEFGHKVPVSPHEEFDEERYEEEAPVPEGAYDYYNTQDVPPPLRYVPYQPERRGLSPIPSVSGYTEGGSDVHHRDSRVTQTTDGAPSPGKSPHVDRYARSPGSIPSNMRSREFDHDDQSVRSSVADYRNTMYTEDSEVASSAPGGQAVRGVGANPNFVHTPLGVESAVASLVDGSMVTDTVLTGESGQGTRDIYGGGAAMAPLEEELSHGHATPSKRSVESHRDLVEEQEVARASPTTTRTNPSEFAEEYEIDQYGRKVPRTRYRHSPTASEVAITSGAVDAAAAAIRAAKDRKNQPAVEEYQDEEFVPEGVQRNKSFKERTMSGRRPANTPSHSVDRLDDYAQPKMGVSGIPDAHDPIPEIGYGYGDGPELETNPSVVEGRLDGDHHDEPEHWRGDITPTQEHIDQQAKDISHHDPSARDLGLAGAAAVATAAALASAHNTHSRQPSQEQDDEWHRTSEDKKRDTLITNPYEGASPVANLPDLGEKLFVPPALAKAGFAPGFTTRSPLGPNDEGYISQGPVKTPDIKGKAGEFTEQPATGGAEDPFFTPTHARHMSGMSQGMGSPFYDAATGAGIDRIESKDIIALMQHLMVRDAQRSARDTEILVTLVRSASEMRESFDNMKKMLAQQEKGLVTEIRERVADTEDVIITEVKENTEKTVRHHIGGPRPFPGSAARSLQMSQAETDDLPAKKRNLFRRALKGLSAKGNNDLGRIEDMLMQLLTEVDVLKAQTAQTGSGSTHDQSFEHMDEPEIPFEQDRGYEPEGNAGTSTASHASQSGHLSLNSRGQPSKLGYERKFSDHRISTVPEANEDESSHQQQQPGMGPQYQMSGPLLNTPPPDHQRGNSVPLNTPPQPMTSQQASLSNENASRSEKGKKHKSGGSTSWLPKISRWSGTTTSSMGKVFRGSKDSKKDDEMDDFLGGASRSGSNLANYDEYGHTDPYGEDKLHTGFSQPDLLHTGQHPQTPGGQQQQMPPQAYMTPEDPKYKAHRNSLLLQHPQPRSGQPIKAALEYRAEDYDDPMSPRSAEWAGSATSLHRFPGQNPNRYSGGSASQEATGQQQQQQQQQQYWGSSPAGQGPPRPPKEPLDDGSGRAIRQTPPKSNRISKLASKTSPLPYHSVESGYGTATHGAPTVSYAGSSPRLENRNLSGALGVPTRRPSGPRAMTPKSAGSVDEDAEARRRKRG
ncbi:uncharacterized protein E0L32_005372 [Thyridium curvatum]|uniref:Uncharacterized protein n=1 Tax=Thyridium curvatum TaxID=1093900 RepID=A0A507BC38_9PEZI|nr:uncharacterized protein E0L32_005372 [Thyridium curvatum]TPX14408.1 hypothetical protein E0L32_005372 [Thyridium curvatum]